MLTIASVWVVPTGERPLEEWRVVETYRGERHFIGKRPGDGRYCVTPTIIRFNPETLIGTTACGLAFALNGRPGPTGVAVEVAAMYSAFDKRLLETADVTDEYSRYLQPDL